MKRIQQLTLASFIAVLGLLTVSPLVTPAGAIDPFGGVDCSAGGTGAGTTTGTDDAATGDTADGADTGAGVGGAAEGGATGDTATGGGGGSTSICGAIKQDDAPKIVTNVINTILFVLGIGAVVMIVIGGIRYTTSNGDSGNIKSAKDTILYAVVGLVVAIMAYAIVNFVLDRLG